MTRFTLILLTVAAACSLTGCAPSKSETTAAPDAAAKTAPDRAKTCEGDAGIVLPAEWDDPLRPTSGDKPDIGAIPIGGEALKVGIDGRITAGDAP